MLTTKEQEFILFWQERRKLNKYNPFNIGRGFTIGVLVGVFTVASITTGWNKQAPLNQMNVPIITICFLLVAIFCAILYSSFTFEQNEQAYQEFLAKQKKYETTK